MIEVINIYNNKLSGKGINQQSVRNIWKLLTLGFLDVSDTEGIHYYSMIERNQES